MTLEPEQRRRLNNIASASKAVIPEVIFALAKLQMLQDTYAAFQASGLDAAQIADEDFEGDNQYMTANGWADFVYAVGVQNNNTDAVRSALLSILDTVPL